MRNKENITRLEKIRKQKGLTRPQLALLSGVSKPMIQKLEDGQASFNEMKISTLLKLSKGLRTKPCDILPIDLARKLK